MKTSLVVLAIVAAACAYSDSAEAQPMSLATPVGSDPITPASFTFHAPPWGCTVTSAGVGMCTKPGAKWRFRLPTDDGRIDRLYFSAADPVLAVPRSSSEYLGGVGYPRNSEEPEEPEELRGTRGTVFAYELTDEESSWGSVVGFRPGSRRPAWRMHVPGLNLAAPFLKGDSVLIAALAFVASIDRQSGEILWRHEQVYDGSGRTVIQTAIVGETVVVTASNISRENDRIVACYNVATGAFASCPVSSD